jgi:hypothetical protein
MLRHVGKHAAPMLYLASDTGAYRHKSVWSCSSSRACSCGKCADAPVFCVCHKGLRAAHAGGWEKQRVDRAASSGERGEGRPAAGECGAKVTRRARARTRAHATTSVPAQDGFTSLHVAAARDAAECVGLLLRHGADVAAIARNRVRCAHCATSRLPCCAYAHRCPLPQSCGSAPHACECAGLWWWYAAACGGCKWQRSKYARPPGPWR